GWCARGAVQQEHAGLLDGYTDAKGTAANPPSPDDVFTTMPGSPLARMRGTNASAPRTTPNTFTPKHQRQSFASCSHGLPAPPDVTPALLKSRWHAPYVPKTWSASASSSSASDTSKIRPSTRPYSESSPPVP